MLSLLQKNFDKLIAFQVQQNDNGTKDDDCQWGKFLEAKEIQRSKKKYSNIKTEWLT
jgi:hypothetical protein